MYLSRLCIKNYRSIRSTDIEFAKGKTVIIGRNNAGKSNIVRALDIVLGENSPTYAKSQNVTPQDFFSWKEMDDGDLVVKSANEMFIWCELKREENEEIDYEELYKCYGFKIRVDSYKSGIPERVSKHDLPHNYDQIFMATEDDCQTKYVNPKLKNQRIFEDKHFFAFAFRARHNANGHLDKDIRFLYRESETEDWILAFKAPIRPELMQSAILPSFRDPQVQLRVNSYTWYGKLMHYLTTTYGNTKDLESALDQVRLAADQAFAGIQEHIRQSSLEVAFPGTTLHLQFSGDSKADLHKNCVVFVDDGFKSELSDKGAGIQSATLIGLFNYYTTHVNVKSSALLCVEEPEVYLHPHARRVVSDRLDDFLDENRNQVILTTHSTEFIRTRSDSLNILLVRRNGHDTDVSQVDVGKLKHLIVDNNQNEIFFADRVVICEGYDDAIVRAAAKEHFPQGLDAANVSVVSVGSKDNIASFVRLMLKLKIKCFVLADFDYFLRDKAEARKRYDAKAHESIANIDREFFAQHCTGDTKPDTVISCVTKVREEIKKDSEKSFYTAKRQSQIASSRLQKALPWLRKHGICILSGEIEDCCKEKGFLNSQTNKLSLDKVYELSRRLGEGEKIEDLFDLTEIMEFLQTVFQ